MITQTSIDQVIDAAGIVEVVGRFVQLKKAGVNYTACCPFHDEKTPSFVVNPAKGIYKCFGCGAGGGSVKFVMELERKNFPEAIEFLAEMFNIPIEKTNEKVDEAVVEIREGIMKVNAFALKKYTGQTDFILSTPDGQAPAHGHLNYIKERFTKEDIAQWQIGYAPDDAKFLTTPVINAGLFEFGKECGLIGEKDGQGYDKLRNRVIFPIQNRNGECIGFGARVIDDTEKKYAKYLNSSDSVVYNKSRVLYGLNFAAKKIAAEKNAYLVEGYTDVIAMHRQGYENTVASCGTALTGEHCLMIKKYCNSVTVLRDADAAGLKAAVRDVELLVAHNFKVEVVLLPEGEDPDSYFAKDGKAKLPAPIDAVMWRIDLLFKGVENDAYLKSEAINGMVEFLRKVNNELLRNQYLKQACKKHKQKEAELRKLFAPKKEVTEKRSFKSEPKDYYIWPDELSGHEEELIGDLQKYGICIYNKMMYGRHGKEIPFELRAISNYGIEVIQHMFDEKFPKKLIKVENTDGDTRIFDILSDEINSIRGLDNAVTRQGNYLFSGTEQHFQSLRKKLFAEMGKGAMIEQLGFQPEKFWATNTHIIKIDGTVVKIDDFGIYKNGVASYYIPSANRNFRTNDFKYHPQKKVVLTIPEVSFEDYASQMKLVHREHSITALLYTIASVFSDLVYDRLKGFPLEFLHGKPSTGKDNLIMACQAIFGHPQAPLNLGNGASTMKAQIRKFAQFRNMVVNLSEYRRGDKRLNEYLKGLWGRDGYERGNIDSSFGTDTMPILSGVFITGNDYPDDDALISRSVVEEFTKTDFSNQEKNDYKKLTAMYNKGVSGLLIDIFRHRGVWEERFPEMQEKAEKEIKADMRVMGANERTYQNFGVIGSAFLLMRDHLKFPFTWSEVLAHLTNCIEMQVRKQASGGKVSKFWDTFMACVRTKNDPLINYQDFRVSGDKVYIQMLNCYGRMQNEWFKMNNEPAPVKSDMVDLLRSDEAFLAEDKSFRFGEGKEGKRSSALVFALSKTGIENSLMELLEWVDMRERQRYGQNGNGNGQPAGGVQVNAFGTENDPDLPF